ncbi:hypothetical protein, partial [Filifactor villosus]
LLKEVGTIAEDYLTLYTEFEAMENSFRYGFVSNEKNELMRIANSKWGRRIIKLAFKLKLNKFFK